MKKFIREVTFWVTIFPLALLVYALDKLLPGLFERE